MRRKSQLDNRILGNKDLLALLDLAVHSTAQRDILYTHSGLSRLHMAEKFPLGRGSELQFHTHNNDQMDMAHICLLGLGLLDLYHLIQAHKRNQQSRTGYK